LFESSEFDVIYENTTVGTVRDEHMTTVLPRNGSSTLKPPDVIHGGGGFWHPFLIDLFLSCFVCFVVSFVSFSFVLFGVSFGVLFVVSHHFFLFRLDQSGEHHG
jgi:hypothetical protein